MITVCCIDSGTGSVEIFRASRFAEDGFDFGKLFQNPVRDLQHTLGFCDRDARHRRGYVEDGTLFQRLHELGDARLPHNYDCCLTNRLLAPDCSRTGIDALRSTHRHVRLRRSE